MSPFWAAYTGLAVGLGLAFLFRIQLMLTKIYYMLRAARTTVLSVEVESPVSRGLSGNGHPAPSEKETEAENE